MHSNSKSKPQGVLIRVRNGDVIAYDATGLRMNLSDSVIENIASRLELPQFKHIDSAVLGDIQAWDLRQDGGWYLFHARLPGAQPVGHFRRRVLSAEDMPPSIIANPSTALFALLALGGARRSLPCNAPLDFPYHILSSDDDMGALGSSGTQEVAPNERLAPLREQCRDGLIAQDILHRRLKDYRALPVIYTRCETDGSSSINGFLNGAALTNFAQSTANLCAAATSMNVPAKVLAVSLDFTLEAVEDSQETWRAGLYTLMTRVTDIFAEHGLRKPLFVAQFDAGNQWISDHPALRGQHELAWQTAGHDFIFSAPSYMFALDEFGRASPNAQVKMAEMDAHAIEALNHDENWACPAFLLAEREEDARIIRVRVQALTPLVIDDRDPFHAGATCGFIFENCTNNARIERVEIAPDDPQDLRLFCDQEPQGEELNLLYALGHPASSGTQSANRGAIRDTWSSPSKTGAQLHRWALPAVLKVN